MKKSSLTTMNYIGIIMIAMVVMIMVFSQQQSVGASINQTSYETEEFFEEGPHDHAEEVSDTAISFVKQNVAGRTIVCCYVNPLYQGITRDHHNARSFVHIR